MNLETLNLVPLNAEELVSIDGGKKLPKPVQNMIDCAVDFVKGVFEGLFS